MYGSTVRIRRGVLTCELLPPHSLTLRMFGGFAVLMFFLAVGELLSALLVPLPGNVIGMILLSVALLCGVLSIESVKRASDVLLDNLAFLFVPPGVGIMVHTSLITENWLAVVLAVGLSTILVIAVTALMQQWLGGGHRRKGGMSD